MKLPSSFEGKTVRPQITIMAGKMSPKNLSDEVMESIAARFWALSESVMLKLIIALRDGEKAVGDLVRTTGKHQTNV